MPSRNPRSSKTDARLRGETGPGISWKPGEAWPVTGLCGEAQADGVPCYELGRRCETCERALDEYRRNARAGDGPAPPKAAGESKG